MNIKVHQPALLDFNARFRKRIIRFFVHFLFSCFCYFYSNVLSQLFALSDIHRTNCIAQCEVTEKNCCISVFV